MCTGPRKTADSQALRKASHISSLLCSPQHDSASLPTQQRRPQPSPFLSFPRFLLPHNCSFHPNIYRASVSIMTSNNLVLILIWKLEFDYRESVSDRLCLSFCTRPHLVCYPYILWAAVPCVRSPFLVQT